MVRQWKIGMALIAAGCAVAAVPANAQGQHGVSWSGDVDDVVIVYVHGDRVRTETVSGHSPWNVSTNVFGRLPDRPVRVWLSDQDGRGRVRVIQQPGPDNDFTAAVRIHDPQSGKSHYHFDLNWERVGPIMRRGPGF